MGDDEWEQKGLTKELVQGRELARQLHMLHNAPASSNESRELLLQKILASYEKALAMLNCRCSVGEPQSTGIIHGLSDSPSSFNESPRSEDSDREFKDHAEPRDSCRTRNKVARWSHKVRVSPGMGIEGPLDDGFCWRKYGQKDILGAKHPRGYYRCSHRNLQGCQATKQVQRSDEDPTIFEISYRGTHSCTPQYPSNILHFPSPENQSDQPNNNIIIYPQESTQQNPQHEMLLNFTTQLNLPTTDQNQTFPSFHDDFPSSLNIESQNDHGYGVNFYQSGLMNGLNGNRNLQMGVNESHQLAEIVSASVSATSSSNFGMEFSFGQLDLDPNFSFDNLGFFP